MAIKGLIPALAERGKIKIGEKGEMKTSGQGKQFAQPKKLDHFLITTVQRDAAGRLLPDTSLMARLNKDGQKLTELPVRLLYDDIDLNFPTRYSAYAGNRCWCSGDGEAAQRLAADGKSYESRACPCEHLEATFTGQPKCKPLGTLQVLLEGVDRVGGVWKFRTTSWNTVSAILSSLALIKAITGGPLAGIPLTMVLSPKTVTVPTTGQNMVVYVVSMEYRGPEEQLAELGYAKAKQRIERQIKMETVEAEARRLLVAPHEEPPLDQQETAEEFYPEAVTAEVVEPTPKTTAPKAQETAKAKPPAASGPTPTPTPEPVAMAATQSQEPGNGDGYAQGMTLPQVMEVCTSNIHIELPVPLKTTKGVIIGQWVDSFFAAGEDGEGLLHLVFEMRPDLEKVTAVNGHHGLTQELIAKSFGEAGFKVEFQAPGTHNAGDEEAPPKTSPVEDLAVANKAHAQAAAATEAKKAPAQSLF